MVAEAVRISELRRVTVPDHWALAAAMVRLVRRDVSAWNVASDAVSVCMTE